MTETSKTVKSKESKVLYTQKMTRKLEKQLLTKWTKNILDVLHIESINDF